MLILGFYSYETAHRYLIEVTTYVWSCNYKMQVQSDIPSYCALSPGCCPAAERSGDSDTADSHPVIHVHCH